MLNAEIASKKNWITFIKVKLFKPKDDVSVSETARLLKWSRSVVANTEIRSPVLEMDLVLLEESRLVYCVSLSLESGGRQWTCSTLYWRGNGTRTHYKKATNRRKQYDGFSNICRKTLKPVIHMKRIMLHNNYINIIEDQFQSFEAKFF